MDADRRRRIRAYIRNHSVMTLASIGADGPWASAVFYAECPDGLIFLSSPTCRHSRNFSANARGAATIHDDTSDWAEVKGIQIGGMVEQLIGEPALAKRRKFEEKFPIARPHEIVPRAIAEAMNHVAWYMLKPATLLFIDNECGFGHRESVPIDILADS